ncbi:MAG: glycosyltransferase family 39 protein [Methanobacteriota archaeon]
MTRKKEKKRNIPFDLLFGLLLFSLFLPRFVNIIWTDDYQNDEGIQALTSLLILQGEEIYKEVRYVYPPFMPFIGAYYMSIVGVSLVNLRFLAILSSALTPLLLFFIIRETLGSGWRTYLAALLATLPLAVIPLMNSFSRVFYIEPFVTFLSCVCIYAAIRSKNSREFSFFSGAVGSVAMLLKFWAIPTILASFLYIIWTDRKVLKYYVLGFTLVMLPYFIQLAFSEEALQNLLFQAGRGRWTWLQKTKPLWGFWKTLPYISFASMPFLFHRKNRMVFLWTFTTFLFFYTIMPDGISHHTYFMVPVFSMSAGVLAAGFRLKNPLMWIVVALIIFSFWDEKNFEEIKAKMGPRELKLSKVAGYVANNTGIDDIILSDYAMIPFIANRRQAGNLADVSEATIMYDSVTADGLIELSENERPVYIVIESRFKNKKLAPFLAYVNQTYLQEIPPGFKSEPFEVYRRKTIL